MIKLNNEYRCPSGTVRPLRLLPLLFLLCVACTLCTACANYDDNGDLDGMWHLRTVEELSAGEADGQVTEVKEARIYYTFAHQLVSLRKVGSGLSQYVGRFNHTGDSLVLHDFVVFQIEDSVASPEALSPFYLEGVVSRYAVRTLNGKQMVLRSGKRELVFKKF